MRTMMAAVLMLGCLGDDVTGMPCALGTTLPCEGCGSELVGTRTCGAGGQWGACRCEPCGPARPCAQGQCVRWQNEAAPRCLPACASRADCFHCCVSLGGAAGVCARSAADCR